MTVMDFKELLGRCGGRLDPATDRIRFRDRAAKRQFLTALQAYRDAEALALAWRGDYEARCAAQAAIEAELLGPDSP